MAGAFTQVPLSSPSQHASTRLTMRILCCFVILTGALAFQSTACRSRFESPLFSSTSDNTADDPSALLTARFPTSFEDQVRQASEALNRASAKKIHRHSIRFLLPLIGATELDDWPGGARQMMEAASPMVERVLRAMDRNTRIQSTVVDESDGVVALLSQASEAKNDACVVLLPSADTVNTLVDSIEPQVGPHRNLMLVNAQWKRKSDFGGPLFGRRDKQVDYAEKYAPTFHCSNLMVEGEQVRILRTYPAPWRVFLRQEQDNVIDWKEIGSKQVVEEKPAKWDADPATQRDGGRLFDYGQPTYQEIETMIVSRDGYRPKSLAERASAAFTFIKDTM